MIGTDIDKAAWYLREGQVVAIPTETVYGLAGNALSQEAVSTIFSVKQRPSFDPLIIHVGRVSDIPFYAQGIPEVLRQLAESFMPGPLTLLLNKRLIIPDLVTAGSPRVAVRVPQHPVALSLLQQLDFPVAAPSANPFGYISPTTAQHVDQQLGDLIPYILDGGPCHIGVESTIVGMEAGYPTIFRKGGLSLEDIEARIGPVRVREHSTSNPAAPGMLKSHYAPGAPVVLGKPETIIAQNPHKRIGVIRFQQETPGLPEKYQLILSRSGNYREAARRLFAGMRALDAQRLDLIVAELLPEEDLGRAINDRLRRAAAS